jgi:hypothetical protein
MKWVIIILVVIVAVIAIVYLIGYFMPVKHVASAERIFSKSTPGHIWRSITTFNEYPLWRSGLKNVEVVDDKNWKETSGGDTIHFYGESIEPEKHFVTRIMNKDLPYGGSWTYEIREGQNGTTLTITEYGEVYNPIFRFMSKYIFGHDGTIKKYLNDLEKHLNKV